MEKDNNNKKGIVGRLSDMFAKTPETGKQAGSQRIAHIPVTGTFVYVEQNVRPCVKVPLSREGIFSLRDRWLAEKSVPVHVVVGVRIEGFSQKKVVEIEHKLPGSSVIRSVDMQYLERDVEFEIQPVEKTNISFLRGEDGWVVGVLIKNLAWHQVETYRTS